VNDFPHPVRKNDHEGTLRRTFTVTASEPPKDVYFRAARGQKIEKTSAGWLVDGSLTVRIEGGGTPFLRTVDGIQELLVPVHVKAGEEMKLTQELLW
jgi:hypothetical protein